MAQEAFKSPGELERAEASSERPIDAARASRDRLLTTMRGKGAQAAKELHEYFIEKGHTH